jgi:hypothetical protein
MKKIIKDKQKKIKKGTKIYFSNYAGQQVAEYIKEIENGAYTDLICYLNGFKEETKIECFRYQGIIQGKYNIL